MSVPRLFVKFCYFSAHPNSYTYCNVSKSTVQIILRKYGLRSYTAIKKPYLNLNQRHRRVEWAKNILKDKIKSIKYNSAEELWKLYQDEWYRISHEVPKPCCIHAKKVGIS